MVFLSWHLCVEVTLNESIVEKYCVLIRKKIRDEKVCYLMIYIQSFQIKVNKTLQYQIKYSLSQKSISKYSFEVMIKAAMTRKCNTLKKRKSNLINVDINDDFLKSTVNNNDFNDTSQIYDYILRSIMKRIIILILY